jgi:hypothetical protein
LEADEGISITLRERVFYKLQTFTIPISI